MRQVIAPILAVAALVALVAFGLWIYRRGWSTPAKVFWFLIAVAFGGAVMSGPWGADRGPAVDLVVSFGIVIIGGMLLNRFRIGWQPWAISAVTIALLAVMWVPRILAGELNFLGAGSSHQMTAPATPPPASAPSIAAPPAPAARPQRQGGSRRHDDGVDCDNISPDARAAVGCRPLRPQTPNASGSYQQ